ncbi:MAG: transketolase [Acidobacteria bacterium]|nr:transketolase [Acidobacteriota bacterium]
MSQVEAAGTPEAGGPPQRQPLDVATDTLRFLAVDMVERANSGHPGAPMGQAAMAALLWTKYLRFSPRDPQWPNRDRFVLSCGHASALIYGLLHLAGYDLSLDEIRNFRQYGSLTPGHPEHGLTPGVEVTTGPLGQGISAAVGMAIAEQLLAVRFNRPGHVLFNHRTWVLASDGDLMEGVASEACSMAGHLGLGKLNVLYDANRITIDGPTDLSFSEDVLGRYQAYGWHTLSVEDGNDIEALDAAFEAALAETDRPSLIQVRTHIGYGSPNKQDTAASHGAPLGAAEVVATKEALGWPLEPEFLVPSAAREAFLPAADFGSEAAAEWHRLVESYRREYPEAAAELDRRLAVGLPVGWRDALPRFEPDAGPIATRSASGVTLNALKDLVPELAGGSADLTGSNNTLLEGEGDYAAGAPTRHFRFGVREHAMAAAMNGLALSGLFRPYGGTFLCFLDYLKPSLRLAALMELRAIYVFTHDSVFLGEDGPTHQPIEHLAHLRAVPGLVVLRPADANETAAAWALALETPGPCALVLTRQKLPVLEATVDGALDGVARGAYVLADGGAEPDLILIATGSEVAPTLEAASELEAEGHAVRVVSMPSWEAFAAQSQEVRDEVLPPGVRRRLAVEAAATLGWERWTGSEGDVLGLDRFGASAPYGALVENLGINAAAIAARARLLLDG